METEKLSRQRSTAMKFHILLTCSHSDRRRFLASEYRSGSVARAQALKGAG
jgi:hypothetical protein